MIITGLTPPDAVQNIIAYFKAISFDAHEDVQELYRLAAACRRYCASIEGVPSDCDSIVKDDLAGWEGEAAAAFMSSWSLHFSATGNRFFSSSEFLHAERLGEVYGGPPLQPILPHLHEQILDAADQLEDLASKLEYYLTAKKAEKIEAALAVLTVALTIITIEVGGVGGLVAGLFEVYGVSAAVTILGAQLTAVVASISPMVAPFVMPALLAALDGALTLGVLNVVDQVTVNTLVWDPYNESIGLPPAGVDVGQVALSVGTGAALGVFGSVGGELLRPVLETSGPLERQGLTRGFTFLLGLGADVPPQIAQLTDDRPGEDPKTWNWKEFIDSGLLGALMGGRFGDVFIQQPTHFIDIPATVDQPGSVPHTFAVRPAEGVTVDPTESTFTPGNIGESFSLPADIPVSTLSADMPVLDILGPKGDVNGHAFITTSENGAEFHVVDLDGKPTGTFPLDKAIIHAFSTEAGSPGVGAVRTHTVYGVTGNEIGMNSRIETYTKDGVALTTINGTDGQLIEVQGKIPGTRYIDLSSGEAYDSLPQDVPSVVKFPKGSLITVDSRSDITTMTRSITNGTELYARGLGEPQAKLERIAIVRKNPSTGRYEPHLSVGTMDASASSTVSGPSPNDRITVAVDGQDQIVVVDGVQRFMVDPSGKVRSSFPTRVPVEDSGTPEGHTNWDAGENHSELLNLTAAHTDAVVADYVPFPEDQGRIGSFPVPIESSGRRSTLALWSELDPKTGNWVFTLHAGQNPGELIGMNPTEVEQQVRLALTDMPRPQGAPIVVHVKGLGALLPSSLHFGENSGTPQATPSLANTEPAPAGVPFPPRDKAISGPGEPVKIPSVNLQQPRAQDVGAKAEAGPPATSKPTPATSKPTPAVPSGVQFFTSSKASMAPQNEPHYSLQAGPEIHTVMREIAPDRPENSDFPEITSARKAERSLVRRDPLEQGLRDLKRQQKVLQGELKDKLEGIQGEADEQVAAIQKEADERLAAIRRQETEYRDEESIRAAIDAAHRADESRIEAELVARLAGIDAQYPEAWTATAAPEEQQAAPDEQHLPEFSDPRTSAAPFEPSPPGPSESEAAPETLHEYSQGLASVSEPNSATGHRPGGDIIGIPETTPPVPAANPPTRPRPVTRDVNGALQDAQAISEITLSTPSALPVRDDGTPHDVKVAPVLDSALSTMEEGRKALKNLSDIVHTIGPQAWTPQEAYGQTLRQPYLDRGEKAELPRDLVQATDLTRQLHEVYEEAHALYEQAVAGLQSPEDLAGAAPDAPAIATSTSVASLNGPISALPPKLKQLADLSRRLRGISWRLAPAADVAQVADKTAEIVRLNEELVAHRSRNPQPQKTHDVVVTYLQWLEKLGGTGSGMRARDQALGSGTVPTVAELRQAVKSEFQTHQNLVEQDDAVQKWWDGLSTQQRADLLDPLLDVLRGAGVPEAHFAAAEEAVKHTVFATAYPHWRPDPRHEAHARRTEIRSRLKDLNAETHRSPDQRRRAEIQAEKRFLGVELRQIDSRTRELDNEALATAQELRRMAMGAATAKTLNAFTDGVTKLSLQFTTAERALSAKRAQVGQGTPRAEVFTSDEIVRFYGESAELADSLTELAAVALSPTDNGRVAENALAFIESTAQALSRLITTRLSAAVRDWQLALGTGTAGDVAAAQRRLNNVLDQAHSRLLDGHHRISRHQRTLAHAQQRSALRIAGSADLRVRVDALKTAIGRQETETAQVISQLTELRADLAQQRTAPPTGWPTLLLGQLSWKLDEVTGLTAQLGWLAKHLAEPSRRLAVEEPRSQRGVFSVSSGGIPVGADTTVGHFQQATDLVHQATEALNAVNQAVQGVMDHVGTGAWAQARAGLADVAATIAELRALLADRARIAAYRAAVGRADRLTLPAAVIPDLTAAADRSDRLISSATALKDVLEALGETPYEQHAHQLAMAIHEAEADRDDILLSDPASPFFDPLTLIAEGAEGAEVVEVHYRPVGGWRWERFAFVPQEGKTDRSWVGVGLGLLRASFSMDRRKIHSFAKVDYVIEAADGSRYRVSLHEREIEEDRGRWGRDVNGDQFLKAPSLSFPVVPGFLTLKVTPIEERAAYYVPVSSWRKEWTRRIVTSAVDGLPATWRSVVDQDQHVHRPETTHAFRQMLRLKIAIEAHWLPKIFTNLQLAVTKTLESQHQFSRIRSFEDLQHYLASGSAEKDNLQVELSLSLLRIDALPDELMEALPPFLRSKPYDLFGNIRVGEMKATYDGPAAQELLITVLEQIHGRLLLGPEPSVRNRLDAPAISMIQRMFIKPQDFAAALGGWHGPRIPMSSADWRLSRLRGHAGNARTTLKKGAGRAAMDTRVHTAAVVRNAGRLAEAVNTGIMQQAHADQVVRLAHEAHLIAKELTGRIKASPDRDAPTEFEAKRTALDSLLKQLEELLPPPVGAPVTRLAKAVTPEPSVLAAPSSGQVVAPAPKRVATDFDLGPKRAPVPPEQTTDVPMPSDTSDIVKSDLAVPHTADQNTADQNTADLDIGDSDMSHPDIPADVADVIREQAAAVGRAKGLRIQPLTMPVPHTLLDGSGLGNMSQGDFGRKPTAGQGQAPALRTSPIAPLEPSGPSAPASAPVRVRVRVSVKDPLGRLGEPRGRLFE